MTQTIQPRSLPRIQEKKRNISVSYTDAADRAKTNTRENLHLLTSVYDSLYNLNAALNKLNYVMQSKLMDINMYQENEERKK